MGVDAGDFDNDGDEDLFVTNLTGEGNDLYVNDGDRRCSRSRARARGSGPRAAAYTGFGTAWFDVDNDGWLDTLTVNGAVQTIEALRRADDPFPLHQRKQLFRNLGDGPLRGRHSSRGGPAFDAVRGRPRRRVRRHRQRRRRGRAGGQQQRRARGCSSTRSAAAITGSASAWSAGPGATCSARASASLARTARRCGGAPGRTAATRRPTIHAWCSALARQPLCARLRVIWPSGTTEEFDAPAIDRYTTLREGEGR